MRPFEDRTRWGRESPFVISFGAVERCRECGTSESCVHDGDRLFFSFAEQSDLELAALGLGPAESDDGLLTFDEENLRAGLRKNTALNRLG